MTLSTLLKFGGLPRLSTFTVGPTKSFYGEFCGLDLNSFISRILVQGLSNLS